MVSGFDAAFPWYNSIRFRISSTLCVLFALQAATAGFTLYEVDLRKHDYKILALAGQTRVISHTLAPLARNYLKENAIVTPASRQDSGLYTQNLDQSMALYEKIVTGFRNRRLDPEITGLDGPLKCTWDKRSIDQLNISSAAWQDFRSGMQLAIDADLSRPDLAATS